MNCPKCGLSLPPDSVFCQYCGADISGTVSEVKEERNTKETIQVDEKASAADTGDGSEKTPTKTVCAKAGPEKEQEKTVEKAGHLSTIFNESSKPSKANDNKHIRYCKLCGGRIDYTSKKCTQCGKQYINLRKLILLVLVGLTALALIGLNLFQYIQNRNTTQKTVAAESAIVAREARISELEEEKTSLQKDISQRDSLILTYKTSLSKYQSENAALKKISGYYDDLCDALARDDLGYASSNFKSSESIIVVHKNQSDRKFTLTANWSNGGTVETTYSPWLDASAKISFDSDSWTTSTKITIIPKHEGVTVVTFSNNVDNKAFSVIIIVVD